LVNAVKYIVATQFKRRIFNFIVGLYFPLCSLQLQDLKARKERQAENLQVAKERGSIAFSVDFAQREEARSQEEKLKNGRENLRSIENQRAKAVASLPPWYMKQIIYFCNDLCSF